MKLDDRGSEHYIFFAPSGCPAEFVFDRAGVRGKCVFKPQPGLGSTFRVRPERGGKDIKVTVLTREQALCASKVNDRLLITDATVLPEKEGVRLLSLGDNSIEYVLYPSKAGFTTQCIELEKVKPSFEWKRVGGRRMTVAFDTPASGSVHEYFLNLDYTADLAMAFIDGTMILDHFWYGQPWKIGLKRLEKKMAKEELVFYFRPLGKDYPYLIDISDSDKPDFSEGPVCRINKVEIIPQYIADLPLE